MSVRIRIKFKLGNSMSIIDLGKRKTPPGWEVFALSKKSCRSYTPTDFCFSAKIRMRSSIRTRAMTKVNKFIIY